MVVTALDLKSRVTAAHIYSVLIENHTTKQFSGDKHAISSGYW